MILDAFVYNQHFVAMMNIINLAKIQNVEGKFEKHHIIPRCWYKMNDLPINNSSENLVFLTHDQHITVHKLASMCCKDERLKRKMLYAHNILLHKGSRLYLKTGPVPSEIKNKISNTLKNYYKTPGAKEKTAETTKQGMKNVSYEKLAYWKGKTMSKETREHISQGQKLAKTQLAIQYREYKKNGGPLMWNDWMHQRTINND